MTTQSELLAQNAALELEVMRLREALNTLIAEHEECEDADGWMAQVCSMEAIHVADEMLDTPFTPTVLPAIVERVERVTIHKCAHAGFIASCDDTAAQAIRALPTGQIDLKGLI